MGSNELRLVLTAKPAQRLTPKNFIGANLLLAPAHELTAMCRELIGDNAFISFSPPRSRVTNMSDDDVFAGIPDRPSIDAALFSQICACPGFSAMTGVAAGASFWSSLLDTRGFLNSSAAEIAEMTSIDMACVTRFLENLQNFVEPAGLFAANMEASLLLQLKRRGFEGSCAWRLLTEAKEELTAGRYGECAKLLNISDAEFKAAFSLLRSLDPAPGANFSYAAAVVPEIEFIVEEGAVRPRLILENMPAVENYFADFEASPRDLIRAGWARGEWSAARGALKKLGLRYRTLLRAALLIADVQKEKIRAPEAPPASLSYETAASLLALHTSTVYRAMQNTWCSIGGRSYPMNIFFCRASAGKKSSVAQMRQKIFALRAQGLSNRKIGELLDMPERTVAYHSAKNAKKMRG